MDIDGDTLTHIHGVAVTHDTLTPVPTTTANQSDSSLRDICIGIAKRARSASERLALVSTAVKNRWLLAAANRLESEAAPILEANAP